MQVPQQFVQDGQIVLNISPTAVVGLDVGNDELGFRGRFGGVAQDVRVPTSAVLGLYARENGQGMLFDADDPVPPSPSSPDDGASSSGTSAPKSGKPSLKVVK